MFRRAALTIFTLGFGVLASTISLADVLTGPGGSGVLVGESDLIKTLQYADTFTGTPDGGAPGRPYIGALQPPPAYDVEQEFGNANRTWSGGFSFTTLTTGFSDGIPVFPGDNGAGKTTGFTQTGGPVDYGIATGFSNHYVVQFDSVQTGDRVDITTNPASSPSGLANANGGLSIFFRQSGSALPEIGIYRPGVAGTAETDTGLSSGIVAGTWNNYAARFDRYSNTVEVYVNEQSVGTIDLNTFAGGKYADFAVGAVTMGASGGNRAWTDNAQIGVSNLHNTPTQFGGSNLVTYIPFDESASGTGLALDQIRANNGSFTGTTVRTAGLVGTGAAFFDGNNAGGVNIGNGPNNDFSFTDGITIEAVVSTSTWNGQLSEIFRKEDGNNRLLFSLQNGGNINNASGQLVGTAGTAGISFGLNAGGYGELDVAFDGLNGRPTVAQFADGELKHLVATYDATTGLKSIYLNGELIGQVDVGDNIDITSGGIADAFIGSFNGAGEPWLGSIDEFAIYDSALSSDIIAAHYANVLAGNNYFTNVPEPASVALWIGLLVGLGFWRRRRRTVRA